MSGTKSMSNDENPPASSKHDTPRANRGRRRRALGELSDNEPPGQSFSQENHFSKQSPDGSRPARSGAPFGSSDDVSAQEVDKIPLAALGEDAHPADNSFNLSELQSEDWKLLLELIPSSCLDVSIQLAEDRPLVLEYTSEIFWNMRDSESRFSSKPGFFQQHPMLSCEMRGILVEWMQEVLEEYSLQAETLYLAVNYLDRFLSATMSVKISQLQLIGTASLLIAAKYEEATHPSLSNLVSSTDNTYTKQQLVCMESFMLKVLGFRMSAPSANQFLQLYVSVHGVCATTKNLALYLAEFSLLEIDPFDQHAPSMVAAGAYCLANFTINKALWPDSLHNFTGYTLAQIQPCLMDLHKLHTCAETHPRRAIRDKYKSVRYCQVATVTPVPALCLQ